MIPTSPLPSELPEEKSALPAPHAPVVPVNANQPRRIKELIPMQIEAILSEDPRLIVPIGTCEQHGPHLPLGCDTIIVERMADDLSAEYGVLRAPTVEYGVNVDTERGFTGNASLGVDVHSVLHRWRPQHAI